jgi:hypothetical protein
VSPALLVPENPRDPLNHAVYIGLVDTISTVEARNHAA